MDPMVVNVTELVKKSYLRSQYIIFEDLYYSIRFIEFSLR